jgi:BirA family biotin operon repressor/biotin-[acetyl-CoA-carboxylase] ligase
MHDGAQLVIGLGMNVNMRFAKKNEITQAWTSLAELLGIFVDRNQLSAVLLNHMMKFLEQFDQTGFSTFQGRWKEYDMSYGKTVQIACHSNKLSGKASGIDHLGRLQLHTKDGKKTFLSVGDILKIK